MPSSIEVTSRRDACKKSATSLPPELRVKVYEELLISRSRPLQPNGFAGNGRGRQRDGHQYSEDRVFTSILRTCRTFYEEALPILYERNILAFHDAGVLKPVLPFPEGHLAMVKHVHFNISLLRFGSVEKLGILLLKLSMSRAKLVDLSIRIHVLEDKAAVLREYRGILPPLQPFSTFLVDHHPIVMALFSMEPVQKLDIRMDGEARFGPGVANALRESFLEEGVATGRSINIQKACPVPHEILELEEECFKCGNTKESLVNGTGYCEYQDDIVTHRLAKQFNKHERREALEMVRREIEAKLSQNDRGYTTATKKTKAKFAETFSRSAAR